MKHFGENEEIATSRVLQQLRRASRKSSGYDNTNGDFDSLLPSEHDRVSHALTTVLVEFLAQNNTIKDEVILRWKR